MSTPVEQTVHTVTSWAEANGWDVTEHIDLPRGTIVGLTTEDGVALSVSVTETE